MKKLIIILSILILVASSVFASDKRIVIVSAKVEAQNPSFVLRAGLSPDAFDRAVSDEDATSILGWETVEKSIKSEDVIVYFEVVQKGLSRAVGDRYSLTIEASEMILGFKEDGSALDPNTKIYKTTKGKVSDVAPIGGEKAVEVSNVKSIAKDTAVILTEYTGVVEDGTPIAKFTVTWPKDIDAPDGIYQASVILKVSQQ